MNLGLFKEEELVNFPVDYNDPGDHLIRLNYFTISNRIDINWLIKYTEIAKSTCKESSWKRVYFELGLAGETGELCDVVKRIIRGDYTPTDQLFKDSLFKELGDVLWYIAMSLLYSVDNDYTHDINNRLTHSLDLLLASFNMNGSIVSNNIIHTTLKINNLTKSPVSGFNLFTILQFIDVIATQFGSSIKEIGERNNITLADRKKRGVLHGFGDDR